MSVFSKPLDFVIETASKLPLVNLIVQTALVGTSLAGCPQKDTLSIANKLRSQSPEYSAPASSKGSPHQTPVIAANCEEIAQDRVAYTPCLPELEQGIPSSVHWQTGAGHTCGWLSIHPSTGLVTGTPNDDQVGECTLAIYANDPLVEGMTESNVLEFTITVTNQTPTLTIANPDPILEDSAATIIRGNADVQSSDEGYGTYSLVAASANDCAAHGSSLTVNAFSGQVTFEPVDNYYGICYINISFDDGNDSGVVSSEFAVTVTTVNDQPHIISTCLTSVEQSNNYECLLDAADADGDYITWSLDETNTCEWASIIPGTNEVMGSPNNSHVGSCELVVVAWDGLSRSENQSVMIEVGNVLPTLTIADAEPIFENSPTSVIQSDEAVQSNEEGSGTYQLIEASFNDCADHALTLEIKTTTGAISYHPTPFYFGSCNVAVSFDDGHGGVVTDEFLVTVTANGISCRYLAYEGFDYNQNQAIQGLNGGNGWALSWHVQNNITTVPGYNVAGNSSLSYGALRGVGRYLVGGSTYHAFGRRLDVSSLSRLNPFVSDDSIGKANSTIYISALLSKSTNDDSKILFHLQNNSVEWVDSSPRIFIGFMGEPSKIGSNRYWTMQYNNEPVIFGTERPVQIGQPTLFVIRLQWAADGATQVDVFINPTTLGDVDPVTPDLSLTLPQTLGSTIPTFRFKNFSGYLGEAFGKGALDEIRIADSFRCATPTTAISVISESIPIITASGVDGVQPYTVTLDGSHSVSGTLNIARFDWDFGDGTTPITDQISATHTFNSIGKIPVKMTITDTSGHQTYVTQIITVRDSNNTFPCLTQVQVKNEATCGQSDGSLQVWKESGISHRLINTLTQMEATPSGNNYNNLAPGTYTYQAWVPTGCSEERTLTVTEDQFTCPNYSPDFCDVDLGMNLEPVSYYDQGRMFKDFMKTAGQWISYNTVNDNSWNTGNVGSISLDTDGYPLQLPVTVGGSPQGLRLVISADGHLPPGDYVLLYEGEGTIRLSSGPSAISYTPNRITFTIPNGFISNFYANMSYSNGGNRLRNIRILRSSDESSYDPNDPFYEVFLDRLRPFKAIRFLNWTDLNNTLVANNFATDRKPKTYYSQGNSKGVAYEYIIALAKKLQKDIWINIPHLASESYVTELASFFYEEFKDTNINIYLEYSNEVWNYAFAQAGWVDSNGPDNLTFAQKYVDRALPIFKIWETAFGSQKSKLKRVFNVQAVNPTYARQILAYAPPDSFDYVSPDWYFYVEGACRLQLLSEGSSATAPAVVACMRSSYESLRGILKQTYLDAKLYGKSVINYEGGQAIMHLGVAQSYQQAYYDAQIIPSMYDLYNYVLNDLRSWGSKMPFAFQLSGKRQSVWGSWGALESIDQAGPYLTTAPKYQALIDNLPANRPQCQ